MSIKTILKSSYANRGMTLEEDINITNKYYLDNDIAVIYKKPTPIRITKYNYNKSKIVEAFFETQSTLDYNGIYKGKYLEFDAKQTNNKTSLPLANIHKHQLEHIKRVLRHKGIAFLIVRFTILGKDFILMGNDLLDFIENNNRKSIPLAYFLERGLPLTLNYSPRLDYIKAIDKLMEEL